MKTEWKDVLKWYVFYFFYISMSEATITKKIFKIDIQTFITICVFVFWLGISRATIMNGQNNLYDKQNSILASLDKIEKSQEKYIISSSNEHKIYDKKLAFVDNRITPTLNILAERAGLQ